MPRLRRKRFALIGLSLLVLGAGVLAWGVWAGVQQDRVNAALIAAIQRGDLRAVRTCLDRGADPNAGDSSSRPGSIWQHLTDLLHLARGQPRHLQPTALILAAEYMRPEMMKLLLDRGADINARESEGLTALSITLSWEPDLCKMLLMRGADPNVKTPLAFHRDPVLIAAINLYRDDLMQLMLDKGANPNTKDHQGTSALLIAVREGHSVAVKNLLARGADVNATDIDGRTALMWALRIDKYDFVQALLARNPNVNIRDKQGRTALMLAAENGDYDTVKALLDRGADPNARDQFGNTAWQLSQGRSDTELTHLLEQAGAKE